MFTGSKEDIIKYCANLKNQINRINKESEAFLQTVSRPDIEGKIEEIKKVEFELEKKEVLNGTLLKAALKSDLNEYKGVLYFYGVQSDLTFPIAAVDSVSKRRTVKDFL